MNKWEIWGLCGEIFLVIYKSTVVMYYVHCLLHTQTIQLERISVKSYV